MHTFKVYFNFLDFKCADRLLVDYLGYAIKEQVFMCLYILEKNMSYAY